MSRILITGVSSGIGRQLTKRLILDGHSVWGIARRLSLLKTLEREVDNSHLKVSGIDLSKQTAWKELVGKLTKDKFIPRIIVFNAAINSSDLSPFFNSKITEKVFYVNFFSIITGVEILLKFVKPGAEFIAISSLSALKGSSLEGVGYPASKAALSIAFESLQRKFGEVYSFKIVYFGPVASGMGPFKKALPVILSEDQAVEKIVSVIKSKQIIHYYPRSVFLALKLIKFFPSKVYLNILSKIETLHLKLEKKPNV